MKSGWHPMSKTGADHGNRTRRARRLVAWLLAGLIGGLDASAQQTNSSSTAATPQGAPPRADFSSFRIVAERNIFNASRAGGRPRTGPASRPTRVDSFALVGTMGYEKGTFAFFDGNQSEYRKTLQRDGSIAGYKVLEVQPNLVRLAAGTNRPVELKVGMQMRREDEGDWQLSDRSESYASTGGSSSSGSPGAAASPASSSGGDESDVVKRLMALREKETK